jgi:hypothetical protein
MMKGGGNGFRGHGLANITSEERKKELNFEMVTPREHIL